MGQHAICSTAANTVQRPVRLHAVSVKLACRKSAFNRGNSQLQLARPAARAASCRTKIVMGLPIPIIGKRAILEAWQKVQYRRLLQHYTTPRCLQDLCSAHFLQQLPMRLGLQDFGPTMTRPVSTAHKRQS